MSFRPVLIGRSRIFLRNGRFRQNCGGLGGCRSITVIGDGSASVLDATEGWLLSVDLR